MAIGGRLHLLDDFDAEEVEAEGEGAPGEVAEDEAGVADDFLGGEDWARFPEAMEQRREFEEVKAEVVRAVFLGGHVERVGEIEELAGEGELGGFREKNGRAGGVDFGHVADFLENLANRGLAGLAKNGPGADVGVLQVGRSVAVEGEQLFPAEDVVEVPVLREVGIFERAEADDARQGDAVMFIKIGPLFRDEFSSTFLRLGDERLELDGVAFAGLEGLLVRAEDGAEPDVLELHVVVTPAMRGVEELAEMHLLASVDDIDRAERLEFFTAIADGGEIGRGVVESAVGFADEEGVVPELAVFRDEKGVFLLRQLAVGENGNGPFAVAGDALLDEVVHDAGQRVIVEAFAQGVIELHAEPLVKAVEGLEGIFVELLPELAVLGVALLEEDELALGGFSHGFVDFRFLLDFAINRLEMAEGIFLQLRGIAVTLVTEEDHAETGAPVADMIVGNNVVAEKTIEAREGIAEDGAAQMADVHLLGDIGTAVIDDQRLRFGDGIDSETDIEPAPGDLPGEVIGLQAKIEETGAGDLGLFGEAFEIDGLGQLGGEVARIGLGFLGENHGGVGLEIAVAGVRAWAHVGSGRDGREELLHGLRDAGFHFLAGGVHRER